MKKYYYEVWGNESGYLETFETKKEAEAFIKYVTKCDSEKVLDNMFIFDLYHIERGEY